ncbi:hypothetical protein L1887_56667 [Cichorium endivia]|nr:hypothetical protein L1887_56667 [Cichorium endivia]
MPVGAIWEERQASVCARALAKFPSVAKRRSGGVRRCAFSTRRPQGSWLCSPRPTQLTAAHRNILPRPSVLPPHHLLTHRIDRCLRVSVSTPRRHSSSLLHRLHLLCFSASTPGLFDFRPQASREPSSFVYTRARTPHRWLISPRPIQLALFQSIPARFSSR